MGDSIHSTTNLLLCTSKIHLHIASRTNWHYHRGPSRWLNATPIYPRLAAYGKQITIGYNSIFYLPLLCTALRLSSFETYSAKHKDISTLGNNLHILYIIKFNKALMTWITRVLYLQGLSEFEQVDQLIPRDWLQAGSGKRLLFIK